jgi:hypothetical protein
MHPDSLMRTRLLGRRPHGDERAKYKCVAPAACRFNGWSEKFPILGDTALSRSQAALYKVVSAHLKSWTKSRLPRLLFGRVSVFGVGYLANWLVRPPLITLGIRLVLLRGVGRTPNIGGVLP